MSIPLTLRLVKGSKLTFAELDQNFVTLRNAINSVSASDTFVTGVTYTQSASTLTLTRNDGVSLSTTIVSSGGGGGTFTGNTSATCINELWVSSISGCSPVTIGTEVVTNGQITANNDIKLPDNSQLMLGDSQDFRIYHDGTNTRVAEVGTGNLLISGTEIWLSDSTTGKSFLRTYSSQGKAELLWSGSPRLYTSADGVVIQNEDLLVEDGNVGIGVSDTSAKLHVNNIGSGDSFLVEDSTNPDSTPFVISSGGSVSIGTTNVFSAGGTKSKLQTSSGSSGIANDGLPISSTAIFESNTTNAIGILSPDSSVSQLYFGTPSDAFGAFLRWDYDNKDLTLSTATNSGNTVFQTGTGVEAVRINANGNVGIGTGSPQSTLDVTGETRLSGSGQNILTVIGSGATEPLFMVQGSSGELFSITDSLTGSLFAVNDISGLPILEVFDDNTVHMGSYQSPSLNTTVKLNPGTGLSTVYSLPVSAYTGAFFDYTVSNTTGARAGNIMSIFSGSTVEFNETTTNDIGSTTPITFTMSSDGSNASLQVSAATTGWEVKTIVRSI